MTQDQRIQERVEDDEYLMMVARLEQRLENQSGVDKTWVEEALREFQEHYRQAVRVR